MALKLQNYDDKHKELKIRKHLIADGTIYFPNLKFYYISLFIYVCLSFFTQFLTLWPIWKIFSWIKSEFWNYLGRRSKNVLWCCCACQRSKWYKLFSHMFLKISTVFINYKYCGLTLRVYGIRVWEYPSTREY